MTVFWGVLAVLASLLLLVMFVALEGVPVHLPRSGPPVRRRVIANLRGGDVDAFRGVLWQRRGRWLVLRDVEVIVGAEATPAEGEVLVDRDQVLFLQFLP